MMIADITVSKRKEDGLCVYLFDTTLDNTSRRGYTNVEDLHIYTNDETGKMEVAFKSKNMDVDLFVDGISDARYDRDEEE